MSSENLATALKTLGNNAYTAGKFSEAILAYTRALRCVQEPLSNGGLLNQDAQTLMLNRSKAYEQAKLVHLAWIDAMTVFESKGKQFTRLQDWVYLAKLSERVRQLQTAQQCLVLGMQQYVDSNGIVASASSTSDMERTMALLRPLRDSLDRVMGQLQEQQQRITSPPEHSKVAASNVVWNLNETERTRLNAVTQRIKTDFLFMKRFAPDPFGVVPTPNTSNTAQSSLNQWLQNCSSKTTSAAIEIRASPLSRLGVFATRDIRRGELFFSEDPVATGVTTLEHCDGCGNANPKVCCPHRLDCPMRYCTEDCRMRAWRNWHVVECHRKTELGELRAICSQGYSGSSRIPLVITRLVNMWLANRKHQRAVSSETSDQEIGCSVLDSIPVLRGLIAPSDPTALATVAELEQGRSGYSLSQALFVYNCVLCATGVSPAWLSFSDFDYMMAVLIQNIFGHSTVKERRDNRLGYGTSLYEIVNHFNHSCMPQASWSMSDDTACFRLHLTAETDIIKGDEIFISYFNSNRSLEQRRASMLQYGFTCQCLLCKMQDAVPSLDSLSATN